MENDHSLKEFELICVIVNFGLGTRVIKIARGKGVSGGTILLGKGTVRNRILEFLDLYDVRKEIILMVSEKKTAHEVLEALDKQLHLRKPDHGVAFSTSVQNFLGTGNYEYKKKKESRREDHIMYNAIFVLTEEKQKQLWMWQLNQDPEEAL